MRCTWRWVMVAWVVLGVAARVAGEAPAGGAKEAVIPVGETVEVANLAMPGNYALLMGDDTFVFNRKERTLTKVTIGDDAIVETGAFVGDNFYCVLADRSNLVVGLYRFSVKTGKTVKVTLAPTVRADYARERWRIDHRGSMEGFQADRPDGLHAALQDVTLIGGRLYMGVRDTGLLEFDPATGGSRLLVVLATEASGGGGFMDLGMFLPPATPVLVGGKLFWFSVAGPVFLDPATAKWELLAPKMGPDAPDLSAAFDKSGGAISPLDMSFMDYNAIYVTAAFGGRGRPVGRGAVYYEGGLFLSDGVLTASLPWDRRFMVEDVTQGLESNSMTVGDEVWIAKRGVCKEDTKCHLFRTANLGRTWTEAPLPGLSKPGISCALVDVAPDAVVLLVHDRAAPEKDYLLVRPRSSLHWGSVPKSLCSGTPAVDSSDDDDVPQLPWKTKRLWKKTPDPNVPAPPRRPEAVKPKKVSRFEYQSDARVGDYAVYFRSFQTQRSPFEIVRQVILVEPNRARVRQRNSFGHEMLAWYIFGYVRNAKTFKGTETIEVGGKPILCDVFEEPAVPGRYPVKVWYSHDVPVGGLVKKEVVGYSTELLTEFGNRPVEMEKKGSDQ